MKEQIKEIRAISKEIQKTGLGEHLCDAIAVGIYDAGYRKQSEGEWEPIVKCKTSTKTLIYYQCSLCGVYLATQSNFCPNCEAKMKGGAE